MWLGDQRQGSAVLPCPITLLRGTGSWLGTTAGLDGLEKIHFSSAGVRAPDCPALRELL